MIFRPFVGLPVIYIPNISPRIDCDFAERVGVRHSLVRVITEILVPVIVLSDNQGLNKISMDSGTTLPD